MIITLDGPAASGKTSASKGVAQALGIPYLSSGLLYRAVTYLALQQSVGQALDVQDSAAVLTLLDAEMHAKVQLEPRLEGNILWIASADGTMEDCTDRVQHDRIDQNVSSIAKHPRVRQWINEELQSITPPFVIDGRDMGTVVFPQAQHKFYLTASAEVRAQRRVGERSADFAEVLADLQARDARDAAQSVPAADAVTINSDDKTLEQVVATILQHIGA